MSDFDNEEYKDPDAVSLEPAEAVVYERTSAFERELAELINKHSEENDSGTPDFILAHWFVQMLDAYNDVVKARAAWRGESVELPALVKLREGKRTVPLVEYRGNLRLRNDIGEAEITIRPGEDVALGKIDRVVAVFEEGRTDKKTEAIMDLIDEADKTFAETEKESNVARSTEPTTPFQRYITQGLTKNDDER